MLKNLRIFVHIHEYLLSNFCVVQQVETSLFFSLKNVFYEKMNLFPILVWQEFFI